MQVLIISKSEVYFAFRLIFQYSLIIYVEMRNIMRNSLVIIGEMIRKRRELLGLLQTQLAALSGVSSRTIQLVEQGKGNPSLETLISLIEPLGLRIELVLKEPSKY